MSSFNIGQYIYRIDKNKDVSLDFSENILAIDSFDNSRAFLKDENGKFINFNCNKEYLCNIIIQSQSNIIEPFNIYLNNIKNEITVEVDKTIEESLTEKYCIYTGTILPKQIKEIFFSFIPIHNDFNVINIVGKTNNKITMEKTGLYNSFNIIKNIDNVNSLKKIGIQAEPDSVFLINGEVITVGQSGIYEFLNGLVEVYSIAPIKVDKNFILDYQY